MYNIMYEMSRQSWFDAQYCMLGPGALGRPGVMVWGEGVVGFRMGSTGVPVVDSFRCLAEPMQYCKV